MDRVTEGAGHGNLAHFSTTPGREADVEVDHVGRDVLGGRDLATTSRGPSTHVRGPEVTVDVDRGRGGVWAGDLGRLWGTDRISVPRPKAVSEIATEALQRSRLLPELTGTFRLTKGSVKHAHVVTERGEKRTTRATEATFGQDVVFDVSDRGDIAGESLPMFGGGGRFRATVGDGGQVVGMHGVWRGAEGIEEREVLSVRAALERVGAAPKTKDVRVKDATLGYYSAPSFTGQELMFPVYAVTAEVRDGRNWVPSRVRLVPATDVGQVHPPEHPEPERTEPFAVTADLSARVRPGLAALGRVREHRGPRSRRGRRRRADPRPRRHRVRQAAAVRHPARRDPQAIRPRSFGTSWIGTMGGLNGSQGNAQGFVDEMTAEGWQRRFNWGNQPAWKSDWISNDDTYVDDVDLVFYTGHAGPEGGCSPPGAPRTGCTTTTSRPRPTAPPTCGAGEPRVGGRRRVRSVGGRHHQRRGHVFDRWRGAFDGLHLLLGYAAVTYDNTEEGRRRELLPFRDDAPAGVVPHRPGDPAGDQRLWRPLRPRRVRRGDVHRELERQHGERPPMGPRVGRPRHPELHLPGAQLQPLLTRAAGQGSAVGEDRRSRSRPPPPARGRVTARRGRPAPGTAPKWRPRHRALSGRPRPSAAPPHR